MRVITRYGENLGCLYGVGIWKRIGRVGWNSLNTLALKWVISNIDPGNG